MKEHGVIIGLALTLSGCVTAPISDYSHESTCKLSTDMKTLKIIDVAEETNSYYSVAGIVLSPILVPTTAIISGTYVLVNNTYHIGEEMVKCE